MSAKILVGVDGSEHAQRAVAWCAAHAVGLDAEVIVVHALEVASYVGYGPPYVWLTGPTPEQREAARDVATREWCKPLADAGVAHRVVILDGDAAGALLETARSENVDLVVTGRRGLGGFKELVLGSTSHHLSHHLDRPLVIVP